MFFCRSKYIFLKIALVVHNAWGLIVRICIIIYAVFDLQRVEALVRYVYVYDVIMIC